MCQNITKIEKGYLRWFGHVYSMDARRLMKYINEDSKGNGRPRRMYADQTGSVGTRESTGQKYPKQTTMHEEYGESE